MVGRVIVLVTALLVAVAGVLLVWLYAQRTVAEARAELEPIAVLAVDQQEIPAGTTVRDALADDVLVTTERPRDALPNGYVEPDADVLDLEISSPMYPGEVLVEARLQDPDAADGLAIEPEHLAITLPLADPNRVAQFIQPGDLVGIFLTREGGAEDEDAPPTATTQLLVPDVRVIAVGTQTATDEVPAPGEDVDASLVTVSVLQPDAERLILGQSLGELYLGLLTEGDGESDLNVGRGTSSESLFEATP